jgi:hypothetical protein
MRARHARPSRLRRTGTLIGVGGVTTTLFLTLPLLPAEAHTAGDRTMAISAATAPVTIALAERTAAATDAALSRRAAERAAEIEAARIAAEAEAARIAAEAEAARIAAERAARLEAAQAALGPCAAAEVTTGYANGRVPDSALCDLPGGGQLRSDAALAVVMLNDAYRQAFGTDLPIGDTYRSYSAQVAAKRQKGRMVARPGTSNHGEGIAIDFSGGISRFGTAEHAWMRANAPAYGWNHPGWAQKGGSKPEPWHWEYTG